MNFDTLDWEILDRLRRRFLDEAFGAGPYWESAEDLAQYDRTFGERIGWKWDAVLSELADRQWVPGGVAVLVDWGCGSGVAGRRVLHQLARAGTLPGRVILHDRSARAVDFARDRLAEAFPGLPVTGAGTDPLPDLDPDALVVVSHVLNELPPSGRESLVAGVRRAGGVLWVEPGTRAVARDLQAVRVRLRDVLPRSCPVPTTGPAVSRRPAGKPTGVIISHPHRRNASCRATGPASPPARASTFAPCRTVAWWPPDRTGIRGFPRPRPVDSAMPGSSRAMCS